MERMEGMDGRCWVVCRVGEQEREQNLLRLDSQREPAIDATGEPYGEDLGCLMGGRERERERERERQRETEPRPSPP